MSQNKGNRGFMKFFTGIILFLSAALSLHAADKKTFSQIMAERSPKVERQWKYNPFRVTETERRLVGWQDPYAYVSRFWLGDILSKNQVFQDPSWNLDAVLTFLSPTLATEFAPIAFKAGRLSVKIGVAFLLEANLLAYKNYKLLYGAVPFYSDYLQVGPYIDFIIDDSWKIRWVPIFHICSHAGGDYLGDPAFNDTRTFADMGNENMSFGLYKNWHWFMFYGGLGFRMITNAQDAYGSLFNFFLGMDLRVPVWGKINFITGIYVGASYDEIKTFDANKNMTDIFKGWYPSLSLGVGFEIDRFSIAFKYLLMRSRHVFSYKVMEERIGFETILMF